MATVTMQHAITGEVAEVTQEAFDAVWSAKQWSIVPGALPTGDAFVTQWKPRTTYKAGEFVVNPAGFLVSALADFQSGLSYDATKWTTPATDGTYELGTYADAGNSGASLTVDVATAARQKITLTAATPALTLTVPTDTTRGRALTLRVVQDATGSRVPSWVNVKWAGGVVPAGSTGASQEDIYAFEWMPGMTNWRGVLPGVNFA